MLRFTITKTDGSQHIVNEPVGFDGINLKLLRNNDWHGFFTFIDDSAITLEFDNFPQDNSFGFDILKSEFDTYGLSANALLKIEFACDDNDPFETLFEGRFDFNKYTETCSDRCYCTISIEEQSCLMNFKNRYDQKVDLNDKLTFDPICDENNTSATINCDSESTNTLKAIGFFAFNGLKDGDSVELTFASTTANNGIYTVKKITLNKDYLGYDYIEFIEDFASSIIAENVTFEADCLVLVELDTYPALNQEVEFTPKPLSYKNVWSNPENTIQEWTDEKLIYEYVGTDSQVWLPIAWQNDVLTEINQSNKDGLYFQQLIVTDTAPIFASNDNNIIELKPDSKLKCDHEIKINLRLKGEVTRFCGETFKAGLVLNLRWGDFIDQAFNPRLFFENIAAIFGSGIESGGTTTTLPFDITYTKTITIDPYKPQPQKVYISWEIFNMQYLAGPPTPSNALSFDFNYEISNIEIVQTSICESTFPKVYLINEVFARIAEKYTNNCLTTFSKFFGRFDSLPYTHQLPDETPNSGWGCGGYLSLTNGLKIRNAINQDGSEYSLKVSMKDVFEAMKAVYNIGMGIEYDEFKNDGSQLIRIEPYKYFYDSGVILTCDNVAVVKKSVETNKYISLIDVGYSTWTTESTNGLNDVFTSRNYRTELATVRNTYKAICQFIASDYAIEITRRKWGSITNDWRYDNDTFIALLEPDEAGLKTETFDFPSNTAFNINYPEYAYNLRITPARNILNHISTIFASYKDLIGKKIVFLDGQGNYVAQIDISSEGCNNELGSLSERVEVSLSVFSDIDFASPIFSNEIINFEYPLSYAEWKLLSLNPYGLIEYSCSDGIVKSGWIQELKYNPTSGMGEFILKEAL